MEAIVVDHHKEQLKLLGIFYQILGGAAAVIGVLLYALLQRTPAPDSMISLLSAMLVGVGLCMILAGKRLKRRKSFIFCISMATFACVFFPFGTILGILTFVVLSRPQARHLFRS